MATYSPPARPANAICVWTDRSRLYAEVGGYVTTFPLSEAGLARALALVQSHAVEYTTSPYQSPKEKAQEALRRLGIKP